MARIPVEKILTLLKENPQRVGEITAVFTPAQLRTLLAKGNGLPRKCWPTCALAQTCGAVASRPSSLRTGQQFAPSIPPPGSKAPTTPIWNFSLHFKPLQRSAPSC